MTDNQTPMTPEEREWAIGVWTDYCKAGAGLVRKYGMCRKLRRGER